MPCEIVLPANTEFVPVADIPELIANALHHNLDGILEFGTDFVLYVTEDAHAKAIISAIRLGMLQVLNPSTRLPADEFLPTAIVPIESLIEYVKPLKIAVRFDEVMQGEPTNNAPIMDWKEQARKIADELFDHDTNAKPPVRDSLKGYSMRVMERMQQLGISGPRGILTNHNTIKRDALQGKQWWANKPK